MTTPQQKNDHRKNTAWDVIAPFCDAINIYDDPIVFLRGFEVIPQHVGHLYAVWLCDAEVCNGGFHQFFSNSTGILAPEAATGFRAIGLNECAELLEIAISKFADPFPRDRIARRDELQAMRLPGDKREEWDPFNDLDNRYYSAKQRLKFDARVEEYARENAR